MINNMPKNNIIITKDGWVYALTPETQLGLGDIGVDVEIIDLREKGKIDEKTVKNMIESGMSVSEIARELEISRPTVYRILKK
jgi:DNA invertase Pin-like site-specific DNA recombinase